jgi:hypothetical protein
VGVSGGGKDDDGYPRGGVCGRAFCVGVAVEREDKRTSSSSCSCSSLFEVFESRERREIMVSAMGNAVKIDENVRGDADAEETVANLECRDLEGI